MADIREQKPPAALEGQAGDAPAGSQKITPRIGSAPRTVIAHPIWPMVLGVAGLACGYLGLGLPQHYYQPLFAGLVLLLIWRHGVLVLPPAPWRWPQAVVNFLVLALLFKLLIGGGTSYPFEWLKVPIFKMIPPSPDAPWYDKVVPDLGVTMQGVPNISDWAIDITKIQTLFLVATMAGALFRFQPFASLTALALLIVSIPTFVGFDWDWVLLFLILGGATFYLQSAAGLKARPPSTAPEPESDSGRDRGSRPE